MSGSELPRMESAFQWPGETVGFLTRALTCDDRFILVCVDL
jgi:hypothetical protein